jgi:hypothetical protein
MSKTSLEMTAQLLGIDVDKLHSGLSTRTMQPRIGVAIQ